MTRQRPWFSPAGFTHYVVTQRRDILLKNLCQALEALKQQHFGGNLTLTEQCRCFWGTGLYWNSSHPPDTFFLCVWMLLPCRCSAGMWTTTPRTPTPSRRPSRPSMCGCTPRCAGGTAPSGWSCWAASSQVGFLSPQPSSSPRTSFCSSLHFVLLGGAVDQPEFIQSLSSFYLSYKISSTWLS